jgi:hypothetical protein
MVKHNTKNNNKNNLNLDKIVMDGVIQTPDPNFLAT